MLQHLQSRQTHSNLHSKLGVILVSYCGNAFKPKAHPYILNFKASDGGKSADQSMCDYWLQGIGKMLRSHSLRKMRFAWLCFTWVWAETCERQGETCKRQSNHSYVWKSLSFPYLCLLLHILSFLTDSKKLEFSFISPATKSSLTLRNYICWTKLIRFSYSQYHLWCVSPKFHWHTTGHASVHSFSWETRYLF